MKYDKKNYWQYWRMVVRESTAKVWEKFGVPGAFLALLAAVISAFIIRQTRLHSDISWEDPLIVALVFILFCILAMAFYIFKEPVIIYNNLVQLIEKPMLDMYYDNCDTLCRQFQKPDESGIAARCYIRLKITNNGNDLATKCIGKLRTISDDRGTPYSDWTNAPLAWETQIEPQEITLQPSGDYKYLDIGWTTQGQQLFAIRTDRTLRHIKLDRPPGQYYFHIVINAEGHKPLEQWFKVTWNGKYDNFMMEEVLPPKRI